MHGKGVFRWESDSGGLDQQVQVERLQVERLAALVSNSFSPPWRLGLMGQSQRGFRWGIRRSTLDAGWRCQDTIGSSSAVGRLLTCQPPGTLDGPS